jgi:hypothetical protein
MPRPLPAKRHHLPHTEPNTSSMEAACPPEEQQPGAICYIGNVALSGPLLLAAWALFATSASGTLVAFRVFHCNDTGFWSRFETGPVLRRRRLARGGACRHLGGALLALQAPGVVLDVSGDLLRLRPLRLLDQLLVDGPSAVLPVNAESIEQGKGRGIPAAPSRVPPMVRGSSRGPPRPRSPCRRR